MRPNLTAEDLIANRPHLHGVSADGRPHDWALGVESLRSLNRIVETGWRTLETGAGVSTVLFALKQTRHTCVVPSQEEISRICDFCAANQISTTSVQFVIENSESALPRMDPEPLDLVLLDGSHSFPSVFIDWYYTASRLRMGGWLFIDDIHIWTPRVLRDFLRAEEDWEHVEDLPSLTAIFRKRGEVTGARNWIYQPYVTKRSALNRRSRMALTILRDREWDMLKEKLIGRLRRMSGGGRHGGV